MRYIYLCYIRISFPILVLNTDDWVEVAFGPAACCGAGPETWRGDQERQPQPHHAGVLRQPELPDRYTYE